MKTDRLLSTTGVMFLLMQKSSLRLCVELCGHEKTSCTAIIKPIQLREYQSNLVDLARLGALAFDQRSFSVWVCEREREREGKGKGKERLGAFSESRTAQHSTALRCKIRRDLREQLICSSYHFDIRTCTLSYLIGLVRIEILWFEQQRRHARTSGLAVTRLEPVTVASV